MGCGQRRPFPFSLRAALPDMSSPISGDLLSSSSCKPLYFLANCCFPMSSIWRAVSPTETSVIHMSTCRTGSNINFTSKEVHRPPQEKTGFMDYTGLFSFRYVVEKKKSRRETTARDHCNGSNLMEDVKVSAQHLKDMHMWEFY